MINLSRRQLANWAVQQLSDGQSPVKISKSLAAALFSIKKQKETELLLADINSELENRGIVSTAIVTSAHELPAMLRKTIMSHVEKAAAVKDVILIEEVDKNVIGGIRIETPNHTWDNTITRRLTDIKGGI